MSKKKKTVICLLSAILLFVVPLMADEIHRAARYGDLGKIKSLLAEKPELLNLQDGFGSTALHWAAMRGWREMFDFLIAKGADVTIKERHGGTTLHWAAHNDDPEIVKILIQKGVNVNEKNMMGRAPLHVTARRGCIKATKALLASGAKIDIQNRDGGTPLHTAAKMGHKDMVKFLLSKGASKDIANNKGKTPLQLTKERPKPIKENPGTYDAYTGQYQTPRWSFTITKKNNRLYYESLVLDKLYRISDTTFMSEAEWFQLTFVKNDRGKVEKVIYKANGREVIGKRKN